MNPDAHDDDHPWDRGLAADLEVMRERRLGRRGVLALFAGAGATAVLAACGRGSDSASATTAGPTATAAGTATTAATTMTDPTVTATGCPTEIPEETAGPYPGDGSNGPDVLSSPDVVRRDITTSFGDYTGTAEGVPATVNLTLVGAGDCAPMAGAALYLWHADRDGHYSMYTAPDANYLRGVQVADDKGSLSFTTIVPGCYDGRWPHMHFEIYSSVDDALGGGPVVRTSQLAVPKATCEEAYATAGYESSVTNLTHTSLDSDMVFRDGWTTQLATVTGDATKGYTMSLTVAV